MTAVVIEETGEVVEMMTAVEAERITARIADKLDAIADNVEQVMPLIGEALTRQAWKAMGYQSAQAYVSERFSGALQRLAAPIRQAVVAELSAAGMSTRAIAPIVGTSPRQVVTDRREGVKPLHTSPSTPPPASTPSAPAYQSESLPRSEKVVGIDGKTYPRPETPREPVKQKRRPLKEHVLEASMNLDDALDKLIRLTKDDRFAQNQEALRDRIRINQPQLWDEKIQRICEAYGLNRLAEVGEATEPW